LDDGDIAQAGSARRAIVLAVWPIAVIEVGCYANITRLGNAPGHVLHEVIDPALMLDDHHGGKGA
jgi:hypothetical protein